MATKVHIDVNEEGLVAAGVSSTLADFIFNQPRDGLLRFLSEDKSRWPSDVPWAYAAPADVTDVYPLWSVDAEQVVMWKRGTATEFVWLFHDGGAPSVIAKTETGLLADCFVTLYESHPEYDVSAFRKAAATVGFDRLNDVVSFVETPKDDYREALRLLIAKLDQES